MNELLSKAQKLHEASKASRLGASSISSPFSSFSCSSIDSSSTPPDNDDEINAMARRKPPQPTCPNPSPNPAWCFYHEQFGSDGKKFNAPAITSRPRPWSQLVAANGSPIRCYGTGIAVKTHPYADLLQEFPDVFKAEVRQSPGSPSKHGIYHHITTMGPPTHAKFRRLPPQKLRDAKRAFEDMEQDILKTAIVTQFGSYTFAYSTFGLCNAGATFQRLMDSILGDLSFCVCYVDDILIFSRTKEEHRRHVRAVLKRLQENGLVTLTPLDGVLKGKAKKLEWGSPQHAFTQTKEALANATTLAHFDDNAPLRLTTNASNVACGAVLEHLVDGSPRPLAFFSRKLKPAETRYSTFDRELLAVYLAVRHFRHIMEGKPFTIVTDHQPLRTDLDAHDHLMGPSALEITAIPLGPAGVTILWDTSTGRPRPWIPASCRRKIFDIIHGLSHPSGRSTARLLSEKFIWPGIKKDAREWAKTCINCQTSKISRHTESGIGDFPQPKRCFGHLHLCRLPDLLATC
ncbi:uncharacterized protein [Palaemon carinicauda]|uniref:uncharacterized protein n=1 Tax=Palaemon carinicauda TaxID=392227 RepID=UPI0035B65B0A